MIETEVKKLLKLLPFTQYKLEQMKKLVEKGLEPEISLKDLEEKLSILYNELEKLNTDSPKNSELKEKINFLKKYSF